MRSRTRRDEVVTLIRRNAAEWDRLGVKRLSLFGSVAKDEARRQSDVDILVDFRSGRKNFDAFMTLGFRLEDILRAKVELVTRESLGTRVRTRILDSLQTVWESE